MSCYGCLKKDFCPCIFCPEYKLNFDLVTFQDKDTILISNTLNIEEDLISLDRGKYVI